MSDLLNELMSLAQRITSAVYSKWGQYYKAAAIGYDDLLQELRVAAWQASEKFGKEGKPYEEMKKLALKAMYFKAGQVLGNSVPVLGRMELEINKQTGIEKVIRKTQRLVFESLPNETVENEVNEMLLCYPKDDAALWGIIEGVLTPQQYILVKLVFREGLTEAEVGRLQKPPISKQAISSQLSIIKKRLMPILKLRYGVAWPFKTRI